MTQAIERRQTKFVVYAWYTELGKIYFVSKALKGSPVIHQSKKDIPVPEHPNLIRILKEFTDEDESLEFLDELVFALGLESDGGSLQNHNFNVKHLKIGNVAKHEVKVWDVATRQCIGEYPSVIAACEDLGIHKASGYASFNGKHYASKGKYHLQPSELTEFTPLIKQKRKSRPKGAVHPAAKSCVAYSKAGEFIKRYYSYGECADDLDIPKESVRRMCSGLLYSSGNFCVRPVGVNWEPPAHHTRPARDCFVFSPDGDLQHFDTLTEATRAISGDEVNNIAGLLYSINTPIDKKASYKGYFVFCGSEEVPNFEDITPLRKTKTVADI
jgi:hypothetical protein